MKKRNRRRRPLRPETGTRSAGLRVILSSSSDAKPARISAQFLSPPILIVNYRTNPEWHEEVLRLTDGEGVNLVIEVGDSATLVQSMKCTRRGGIVSQVGYLSKSGKEHDGLEALLGVLIDRRIVLWYAFAFSPPLLWLCRWGRANWEIIV
jgi:NADPH:quinone reductase-like Zn-dependent oxidoreductase